MACHWKLVYWKLVRQLCHWRLDRHWVSRNLEVCFPMSRNLNQPSYCQMRYSHSSFPKSPKFCYAMLSPTSFSCHTLTTGWGKKKYISRKALQAQVVVTWSEQVLRRMTWASIDLRNLRGRAHFLKGPLCVWVDLWAPGFRPRSDHVTTT